MADPVEDFYRRVNARAEADMLNGRPVTGAHHRALEVEIAEHRALAAAPPDPMRAALKALFLATGAESIEIHSGDREPGTYVTRESVLGKEP